VGSAPEELAGDGVALSDRAGCRRGERSKDIALSLRCTASLKEGMAETLAVTRLGIKGALKRTLQSTNPCESMIETVRRTSRNVKSWQSGEMCLRWTAAGMPEAERQFSRIIGHADLARLALAVERQLHHHTTTAQEVTASLT
jgi:transposase-like protein